MVRTIGLHLRLTTTLSDLIDKAIRQKSNVMQCFFILQETMSYISFAEGELEACRQKIKDNFKEVYLHASYWVNLAGMRNNGWRTFKREVELARQLGFSHVVIHPGSATGCKDRQEGIVYLSKALNRALEKYDDITIVLENTAHGKTSVGGDLEDFKVLMALITEPHRIAFCLDTAHAYAYGYDIATVQGLDDFIALVDQCIGLEKVKVLHLNDSDKEFGSRIDKHAAPGKGRIGIEALERCMNHPKLQHASVLLELPVLEDAQELEYLDIVRSWEKK
jgi:deoxyribonuclease-4